VHANPVTTFRRAGYGNIRERLASRVADSKNPRPSRTRYHDTEETIYFDIVANCGGRCRRLSPIAWSQGGRAILW
jgi:hypothetical protein